MSDAFPPNEGEMGVFTSDIGARKARPIASNPKPEYPSSSGELGDGGGETIIGTVESLGGGLVGAFGPMGGGAEGSLSCACSCSDRLRKRRGCTSSMDNVSNAGTGPNGVSSNSTGV